MSNDGAAAVEAWVDQAARELKTTGFAQVDLDDLLPEPPSLAVHAALQCLQLAVAKARHANLDVDGVVTVPLPWSESLLRESPSAVEVMAQPWKYGRGQEVPGLYLIGPSLWRAYESIEEYRRDLGTEGLLDGYVAYYRTWRAGTGADGYDRAIYIRTVAYPGAMS